MLEDLSFVKKVEPIETNIIIFEIDENQMRSEVFIERLKKKNIHIIGMGHGKLRIVTHLDYTNTMHEAFLQILIRL